METIQSIDKSIVVWLNQWVGHWAFVDYLGRLFVSDYFVPVCLSLILVALWYWNPNRAIRERQQRAVLHAMIALGFANLAVFVINDTFFRPRPFTEVELSLLFYRPTDSSFPANPAAVSFAVIASLWSVSRWARWATISLAVLWCLSRIFAGVFYPTDVVAGALIGVAISLLVRLALRLIEPIPTWVMQIARMLHLA